MKVQHIETLVAIAEAGSLRGAALHLGKSQPALTKALRQAEEDLGVVLFQRSARGVVVTEAGERVLTRARTIMGEIARLDTEVAQMRGEQVGTVHVGVSPLAAVRIMPRALAQFRKTYPRVDVQMSSGLFPSAIKPLREGRFDLLVGPVPPVGMQRDLLIEPMFETPIGIVTARESPFAEARSLADLTDADWIMIGAPGGPGDVYRKAFIENGLTPPQARTTSESYFGALALVEGLGAVCSFPLMLLEPLQRDWNIVQIPVREQTGTLPIALMTRAAHPLTPAALALAGCIQRRAASLVV